MLADTAAPECLGQKTGDSPLKALYDPHFSVEVNPKIRWVTRIANHTNEEPITPK